MKKMFGFLAAVMMAALFASCSNPVGSGNDDNKTPEEIPQGETETYIAFNNTQGVCTVIVYNDARRRDTDIIETVQAGTSSMPKKWTAHSSYPFFLSYEFDVPGAEENTILYTPSAIGKDQLIVRIDTGKTTTIPIPKLEDTLTAQTELLNNNSYLIIQNDSSYSFRLMRGTSEITPKNLQGAVVNAEERALYALEGGAASSVYRLLVGADTVNLLAAPAQFAAGHVYRFVYTTDAGAVMRGDTPLDITTVAAQSGAGGGDSPAAPGGLMVTGIASDLISLSWDATSNISGYRIYRSSSVDGVFYKIGSRAATRTPSYTDTGLTSGVLYYYKVSAVNNAGESVKSAATGAKTSAAGGEEGGVVPAVPTGLTAARITPTSIRLSWNAVNGASGYKVYRAISADGTFEQIGTSDTSSWSDTGLPSGAAYYYKVSAVNNAGESDQSASVETGNEDDAPVIIASDSLFTVRWAAVENAVMYEVYISTSEDRPNTPEKTVSGATTVISGLTNKTLYFVWIKAVLSTGAGSWSLPATARPWPANEKPETPSLPVVVPGVNQLTITWEKTAGASSYQVFINTQMTIPASPVKTTSQTPPETSAVIAGLETDVIYYVWVRAANSAGVSGYSTVESGSPHVPAGAPAAPGAPQVTPGIGELTVTWTAVPGAIAYEVWLGTTNNHGSAVKQGGDVGSTGSPAESVTITDLSNNTPYYVWLKAKNSTATSAFSPVASETTKGLGLWKGPAYETAELIGTQNLEDALAYISSNAVSGDNYYIVIDTNVIMTAQSLSFSGKTVSITLLGIGVERQISLYGTGALFTVSGSSGNEVTLVLDNNISLKGVANNTSALVCVNSYGKLIMKPGSRIFENTNYQSSAYGGGVYVNGGTFTMTGGTISGNTASSSSSYYYTYGGGVYVSNGTFTMTGGTISGNTASSSYYAYGGGVCVSNGTFTMTGGTISGNTASSSSYYAYGGGVCVDGGTFTMSDGTISGNTASSSSYYACGGGVYISSGSTFTKTSGVITGYGDDTTTGNKVVNSSGAIQSNRGHAVYISSSKRLENTVTTSHNLDSGQDGAAGGWEEVTITTTTWSWSGNWTQTGNDTYTSNSIAHSGSTWETLTIDASSDCSITVQLTASTEYNCDWGYASPLDGSASVNAYLFQVSGTQTQTYTYTVSAGTHWIYFGYVKDGSVIAGNDNITVQIVSVQ